MLNSPFEYANKTILVTGGVSGIGEAISEFLLGKGSKVITCDIKEDEGRKFVSKYPQASFYKCDVTNDSEVKALFSNIQHLDAVINSAGIGMAHVTATVDSVHPNDVFNKTMDINTYGSFLVSKYAAKIMIDKKVQGNIIFISSIASVEGQKGQIAYSGSKGAVKAMVLPIARDLGRFGIRVNSIEPGATVTPMTEWAIEGKIFQNIKNHTPLKTFGKPIHIALGVDMILKNDFINGTSIRIDGGCRSPHF